VITLGNHVWRRRGFEEYLATAERVIRPANLSAGVPGRGLVVARAKDGTPVAVINLLGSLFIGPAVTSSRSSTISSGGRVRRRRRRGRFPRGGDEREGGARHGAGRPRDRRDRDAHARADERRPRPAGGTAAITDAGMTGPHDSVIGVQSELAVRRMRTGMPVQFRPAENDVRIEGVVSKPTPTAGLRRANRFA
jgi:calcineurin-like phosphoesterase